MRTNQDRCRRPVRVGGRRARGAFSLSTALSLLSLPPVAAASQELADYDYENLSFEGVMIDAGQIYSSRVESVRSIGGRVDLGLLGPSVRVVFGVTHWSSELVRSEVGELEGRLEEMIAIQTGTRPEVALGEITWSDVALHGDLHYLWQGPVGSLGYAGTGVSAHLLRGSGAAIDHTFLDDLLDSVRAGANLHTGIELPLHRRLRIVGEGRYEILEDLTYLHLRLGAEFLFGS